MGELGQSQPSDAMKALSQSFVRQVFVLAIIESVGATALVVLNILEIISPETMTTGVLIWLGVVSVPLRTVSFKTQTNIHVFNFSESGLDVVILSLPFFATTLFSF